ncbi:heterokaryon incompatibility protein [Fusarium heterosporum]|uniref:Heterokaryon incompatibility protein n=1 Tax=Fusarium heterosporum TaxID=42747 RepID=A0A8H5WZX8_FUSHE|nr:heterokaryon incompatibility protein [Fusarium heterosporum]
MIRTLTLLPASSIDLEIHVKLFPIQLDNCRYEALSYTWATDDGDSSLSSSINCEGGTIKVSKNCEKALRKLRRQDTARVLWIDAICIDQNNLDERGGQVALMDLIYSKAQNVVIWLGATSKTIDSKSGRPVSDLFFDYLHPMATEIRDSKARGDFPASSRLYNHLTQQAAEYVSNGTLTPLIRGFLDVILRPWWERVWVVQEAALGVSAIMICGEKTADYDDFYSLFFQLYADPTHEGGLTFTLLEGFKHQMYSVYLVRERVDELGPATALNDVLGRSRRLRATDKRDHIFALLDIFGSFKTQLPPANYKKDEVGVFTDMATTFLRLLTPFEVLVHATNVEDGSKMPSWVTDWSQRPQFHIPPCDGLYNASGGSVASYSVSTDGKELKALGAFVDVLRSIPKVDESSYRTPYVPSRGILGYQKSCEVGFSLKDYLTGDNIREVLWRTLCWNVDAECHSPADSALGPHFDRFYEALTSDKEMAEIEKKLLEEATAFNDICVHSMPLGITTKGYLASVPWTAREGDRIVILAGGEVPFIVRKHLSDDNFRLIGSCYVHGMMNGEAFPLDRKSLEQIVIQ